jgi:hypothetical protein
MGVAASDEQAEAMLRQVKELGERKKGLLTPAEFAAIVQDCQG